MPITPFPPVPSVAGRRPEQVGAVNGKPEILLINPNTTEAMTRAMSFRLRGTLGDGVTVRAATGRFGPKVIASRVGYVVGAHAAVEALRRHPLPVDGVVLGCFGDPGLLALREMTEAPVVGLSEASFDGAGRLGVPFAVLVYGRAWQAMLEEQVRAHAAASLCRGIHVLDGTALGAAADPDATAAQLDRAACELAETGVEVVVLGGAVLAGFAARLRAPVRFMDPLEAAAESLRAMLGRGSGDD